MYHFSFDINFPGNEDHWLFEPSLSDLIDFNTIIDIPIVTIDELGPNSLSPLVIEKEDIIPSSSSKTSNLSNFFSSTDIKEIGENRNDILSKTDVFERSNVILSHSISETFTFQEGVTEFVPWTGCDYTSDNDFDEEDDDLDNNSTVGGGAKKKRKRTKHKMPNPDACLITAATEENLRKLGIDPNSNEGKKQKRKIRSVSNL
jgi:hypothetical protein